MKNLNFDQRRALNTLQSPERRRFFKDSARTGIGLACVGVLLALQQKQSLASSGVALRPPFVLTEQDFLKACIRCGQCVQACPYEMLHLSSLIASSAAGTPYFIARDKPCEMCEDIPCAKACPTGALDALAEDINQAKMGLAVLLDHETCLNWQGLRCDVCYRVCPLIDKAITLEQQHNPRSDRHALFIPTVHSDFCTGCGKCEQACVLEQAAIKVLPLDLAKGELGKHYRLGWQEKEQAGHSLAPNNLIKLPTRMPEKSLEKGGN